MKKCLLCIPLFIGSFIFWTFFYGVVVQLMHFVASQPIYSISEFFLFSIKLLPLSCIFAMIDVQKFIMVNELNYTMSLLIVAIMLSISVFIFVPFMFGHIDPVLSSYDWSLLQTDRHVIIDWLVVLGRNTDLFLTDILNSFTGGIKNYFIFVAPIYFCLFLYSFTIYWSKWKMLNLVAMVTLFLITLYFYPMLTRLPISLLLQKFNIENIFFVPVIFLFLSCILLIYISILLLVRKVNKSKRFRSWT